MYTRTSADHLTEASKIKFLQCVRNLLSTVLHEFEQKNTRDEDEAENVSVSSTIVVRATLYFVVHCIS